MSIALGTNDFVTSPFTILRDCREQAPWSFQGLSTDAGQGSRPLLVPVKWHSLGNGRGDYTIEGMDHPETGWRISIERKSLADLYGTILSRRERFVRELANLDRMEYAAVVVEADWGHVVNYTPEHWLDRQLTQAEQDYRRKTVVRSILAWQLRYGGVRWWLMPNRRAAEVWCFRLLWRWWNECVRIERPSV